MLITGFCKTTVIYPDFTIYIFLLYVETRIYTLNFVSFVLKWHIYKNLDTISPEFNVRNIYGRLFANYGIYTYICRKINKKL